MKRYSLSATRACIFRLNMKTLNTNRRVLNQNHMTLKILRVCSNIKDLEVNNMYRKSYDVMYIRNNSYVNCGCR